MLTDFDHPHTSADPAVLASTLGGKGAGLAIMRRVLDLPVPPGFTIHAAQCATGMTDALMAKVHAGVSRIEHATGRRFGDPANPLLLSVRSGSAQSMPGMMDTILNVGLDPLAAKRGGFDAACYQTFLDQFCRSVLALGGGDAAAVAARFGADMLGQPYAILEHSIAAVFASWHSDRAHAYRARGAMDDTVGTAVTIQAMVFGNRNARSGTGVVFSRNPSTGEAVVTGDWLSQAQGEAIVAGTHTPEPIAALARVDPAADAALRALLPRLEAHYRDMVDVEFTLDDGTLWVLQVRRGKRAPAAAARIALDLADDPAIGLTPQEIRSLVPDTVLSGAATTRTNDGTAVAIARGIAASPGLVTGRIALDCDAAIDMADAGDAVILVRSETSPEDVHGMGVSVGILTSTGGAMSHAALVAREWGIAAVCGADIIIDADGVTVGTTRLAAGDGITIDGGTGEVFAGGVTGTVMDDSYAKRLRERIS